MVSAESIEIPPQLGELTVRDGPGYDSVHGPVASWQNAACSSAVAGVAGG